MNKQVAKRKAETETFQVGDLRKMIASARSRGGVSSVNSQFAIHETCEIYDGCLDGLPDTAMFPRSHRPGDVLRLTNILRDCA